MTNANDQLIVQKFGGTSVKDIDRIRAVAQTIKKTVDLGHPVVVVVSAMSGRTNQLVEWTDQFGKLHSSADFDEEYDVVVSTGEQVTSGLTALALQEIGIKARSCLAWQAGISTDGIHAKARINNIDDSIIRQHLDDGYVVVMPGFQGITPSRRITTLGRGGSDTSAVAIAAALKAHRCDIYTDVDGVYTTDPRVCDKARKMDKITFEEMFEMASLGSKVLQPRSVEMAMKHGVRLEVRSSYENETRGTLIVTEEEIVEQAVVSGIAFSRDEAKVMLTGVPDRPGVSAEIFGALANANINIDMIVQVIAGEDGLTQMTFTTSRKDAERAVDIINALKDQLGFEDIRNSSDVAKVSIVGVGMQSHVGVAQQMFETLAEKGINIQLISTSEIKVSVLIDEAYTELAVRALHDAYGLDQTA